MSRTALVEPTWGEGVTASGPVYLVQEEWVPQRGHGFSGHYQTTPRKSYFPDVYFKRDGQGKFYPLQSLERIFLRMF